MTETELDSLIGTDEFDAKAKADECGVTLRTLVRDGVTADVQPGHASDRVNVAVEDGKIVRIMYRG